MEYEILVSTVLLCILQYLLMGCSSERLDDLSINSRRRPQYNLSCFICHSEVDGGCLMLENTLDENHKYSQSCGTNEPWCMVKRISFTTSTGSGVNNTLPMKTVAIKRNCTSKCDPGCVIMGERTRLYVCSTCCTSHLCNVGSGTSRTWPNFFPPFFFFLLVFYYIPSTLLYNLSVSIPFHNSNNNNININSS